jgi:hypothetical protein
MGMLRADMPSEEEMIELLIFNKEDIEKNKIDFRWIHSREFKYNGDMYDIVKKEEKEGKLFLYCINDSQEEKLDKEFNKKVEETTTNKKQKPNDSNPFKYIVSEPVCYLTFSRMNVTHSTHESYDNGIFNKIIGDVLTPPPEFLSTI